MPGYTRTNHDGRYEVVWEPDDTAAAEQALVAVDGTGVTDASDLPDNGLVELDDKPDVRRAVRERYQAEVSGGG